eukprot:932870-Prymnesium_polylepis.1
MQLNEGSDPDNRPSSRLTSALRHQPSLLNSVSAVLRRPSTLPDGINLGVASSSVKSFWAGDGKDGTSNADEAHDGHILTYKPAVLQRSPLYLVARLYHLSLFYDRHLWVCNVARALYALVLAFVLTYVDGMREFVERSTPVWMNANLEFRTDPCSPAAVLPCGCPTPRLRSSSHPQVTAFVLGGFVLQSVRAWQLRRTNYAALCGSSRNLLVLLAASIPRDELTARRALGRWVSLALELAVLKPRERRARLEQEPGREVAESTQTSVDGATRSPSSLGWHHALFPIPRAGAAIDSDSGRAHLQQNGLLREGEWEAM